MSATCPIFAISSRRRRLCRDRCCLSHRPGFIESNGYNHRDEFSERISFHFLHDAPAVFFDGANSWAAARGCPDSS